jgi:hypothetical protein
VATQDTFFEAGSFVVAPVSGATLYFSNNTFLDWVFVNDTCISVSNSTNVVVFCSGSKDGSQFVDLIPPVSTCDSNGSWVASSYVVTLNSSDDFSGVDYLEHWYGGVLSNDTVFTAGLQGNSSIVYRAVDKAGNWELPKACYAAVDSVAPVSTCSASGKWSSSNQTVVLNASDASSGVDVTYHWLGGVLSTDTIFNVSGEGNFTVVFQSRDFAGNLEVNKSCFVAIDYSFVPVYPLPQMWHPGSSYSTNLVFLIIVLVTGLVFLVFSFYYKSLVFAVSSGLLFLLVGVMLFFPVSVVSVSNGFELLDGSVVAPQVLSWVVSFDAPFEQCFGGLFLVLGLYVVLRVVQGFGSRSED